MRLLSTLALMGCFADTSIKQYNDAPEIEIASHQDGNTFEGGTEVLFRALVSDLNHTIDELQVKWLIGSQTVCPEDVPSSLGESVCFATLNAGDTQIQAEVRDPEGGFAVDILTFEVETNEAPTAPVVEISPDPAPAGVPLEAAISGATDPDGDELSYTIVWYRDNVEYATTDSIGAGVTLKGEVWTVEVSAFDGQLESPTVQDSVTILNGPPLISNLRIDAPDGFYNDSLLTCLADVTDPDGDAFDVAYEWQIDGQAVSTDETLQLTSSMAMPNGVVSCSVVATDSEGEISQDSVSETLLNRLPEITLFELTPAFPVTTDTLLLTVNIVDADDQATTYSIEWTVDGTPVGVTDLFLDSGSFARDQVVGVTLTPEDGMDSGLSQTESRTIFNSPPMGANVVIDPTPATEGIDDLHCLLDAQPYDPDGDSIVHVFEWTLNGSPYTGSTLNIDHTGDGIPASATSTGDTWECTYWAEDHALNSAVVTASIQISPNICYGTVINTHEVSSCTVYQDQQQQNCTPASGVTTCYPQYCDTGETSQPQHYADGTPTNAYCADWGQCEGNPAYDVSGQSGWDWVAGYWSCTTVTVSVPVTVYGGANCGYYDTCDVQVVGCGTPDQC